MFVTTPLRSILSIYPSNGVFLKHQSEFILNSKKSLNCKNFIRLSCVHPIFDDLRSFFFWKKRIQENVSQFEKTVYNLFRTDMQDSWDELFQKFFIFSNTEKGWRINRGFQRFEWIITNKKIPRNLTNILKSISYEGRDFWKCWYDKLLYFIKSKKNQKFVSVGVYHMKVKRIKGYLAFVFALYRTEIL